MFMIRKVDRNMPFSSLLLGQEYFGTGGKAKTCQRTRSKRPSPDGRNSD